MSARVPVVTVVLGAANLVAACLVVTQLWRGSQRDELAHASEEHTVVPAIARDMPAPVELGAVQAQAVFHKSRSFYIAPLTQVVEQPPPDYRFAGSMSIPNRPPSAVLMHNQTNARTKVGVGDQLEGWMVAEVGPGRVVMRLGERSAEITSTSRNQGGSGIGMTVTSGMNVPAAASAPPGMVRILGAQGTFPRAPSAARAVANEAPRLYRPPAR